MSTPLLEVSDLTTWFQTPHGVVRAVDGVSLTVHRGETVGIVGESGSGKSVLARSIMQLLPPNVVHASGHVTFAGRNLLTLLPRERQQIWGKEIAMVFQDPMTSLNPVTKIGTQITETLRRHLSLTRRDATDRAVDLLQQVGIPDARRRLDLYPHELSGGMRQRVCIAIAISCEPQLLIADEPTTALDVTVQRQILDMLQGLQSERDMAMVIITHDLGVVAGYSDSVSIMYAGQVVERASTLDLFDHMQHPYAEALLGSIPRLDSEPHSRLAAIAGRPPRIVGELSGCRFAERCRYQQPECVDDSPRLVPMTSSPDHRYRCFFPIGERTATVPTLGRAARDDERSR